MPLMPPPGHDPRRSAQRPSGRDASWRKAAVLVAIVIGLLALVFIGVALTMGSTPEPVPETLPVPPSIPTAPELRF